MKNIYSIFLAIPFFFISILNAQVVDYVSVGSSYSKQAFYKIGTGEETNINNEVWDIAFSNLGGNDGGIFINESSSFNSNPLEVYYPFHWVWSETITIDPELINEENILYNPEKSWEDGAFNTIRDTSDSNDYGWGYYNSNNDNIEGILIYIIKKRDGSYMKIQILELAAGEYTFRYADLDGSNEQTVTLSKNEAGNDPLIFFSFNTGTTLDIPQDYDLIFTRYISPLDDGAGGTIPYIVTGVLLGPGTQGVAARGIDPSTVDEADYAHLYSADPSTIGHEWKYFSFETGWNVLGDEAYFVQTKEGEKYKIVFTGFGGSTTGVTTLEKTYIGMVSVKNESKDKPALNISPNPCIGNILSFNNLPSTELSVLIHDSKGRLLYKAILNENKLSLPSNWSNGYYYVSFIDKSKVYTDRILLMR